MLLSNRRYTIFEDNIKIGYTKDKWVSAIRNFMIHDDLYYMSTHKNEKFSLLKNGKQIASYSKEPVKIQKAQQNTYHISYTVTEPVEIIELFCLIIDLFHFTDYDGKAIRIDDYVAKRSMVLCFKEIFVVFS